MRLFPSHLRDQPKTFLKYLLMFLLFLSGVSTCKSATLFYEPQLRTIIIDGFIDVGDFDTIQELYSSNPDAENLYIHSPGGDFMTAVDIGAWIRAHHLSTYASSRMCYSACGYIWLGGEKRYANDIIGIHMPFYRNSAVTIDIPHEGIARVAWYLASLGYDRALLDALLVVSYTESDELFPITGPDSYMFKIGYSKFDNEGDFVRAYEAARVKK